jgi:hypothetical protein
MNRAIFGSPDKTNLLAQLAAEDFDDGLLFIDTTGHSAEVLANAIPPKYVRRTVYLDPSDKNHPLCFNALNDISDKHAFAQQMVSVFDAVFPEGATTLTRAKANFALLNILIILLHSRRSTFMSVMSFLTDTTFRETAINKCTDTIVLANWETIARDDAALALLITKIGTLLVSPALRNIIGQRRNTLLRRKQIVIADLDRGKIGDTNARLLGWLLMLRSTGPVYITDLAPFSTDHMATLLPQERYTVACRFLSELTPKLRDAVLGIDDKYVLKTNPRDAKELAYCVNLMEARPLVDLDRNEVRTTTGIIQPSKPPRHGRLAAILKRTRACHTRTRWQVEHSLGMWTHPLL